MALTAAIVGTRMAIHNIQADLPMYSEIALSDPDVALTAAIAGTRMTVNNIEANLPMYSESIGES